MTQIDPGLLAGKSKRKIHPAVTIDMTPMVDLGFLLITFFIFTTTMAEDKVMKLVIPKDTGDSTGVPAGKAITALLGKDNKIVVYTGEWQTAIAENKIIETDYNVYQGLGNLIRAKQKALQGGKDKLVYIIKPLVEASYQNVIDALDEALINDVQRYAITEPSENEIKYVQQLKN